VLIFFFFLGRSPFFFPGVDGGLGLGAKVKGDDSIASLDFLMFTVRSGLLFPFLLWSRSGCLVL